MSRSRIHPQLYTAMAGLGFALLALAMLVGLYHSVVRERRLPGIGLNQLHLVFPHLEAGDHDRALRELRSIAAIDPTNATALEMFAGLAAEQGDHASHVFARRQVLLSRPKDPEARLALAEALLAQARARIARSGGDEARGVLREAAHHGRLAVALAPGSGRAHAALSEILVRQGLRREAAFHRSEARRIDATPAFAGPAARGLAP